MSALADHLSDYLTLRRGLGFALGRHGHDLQDFVAFLDAAGAERVTVDLAVAWVRSKEQWKPITVDFRMSAVRGFADYLHAIDPATEVPPAGLLSAPRRRPAPHVYSPAEITDLLDAAAGLKPQLRAATFTTLLGLLTVTGMRLGEARALTRHDVALEDGLLIIRHAKFDRMRLVPLHATTAAALRRYALTRDLLCPEPRTDRFFVSSAGGELNGSAVDQAFRALTTAVGLREDGTGPRVHDLRHTFAVRTLIDWQRDGVDISTHLPVLSTYLGHVEPKNTYWYYSDSRVIPMPAPSCA
jgi:integrase/recombinase XerD